MTINEFLSLSFTEQLRLALEDLKRVSKDPRYLIDMRRWHEREEGEPACLVCLAGAKLTEWIPPSLDFHIVDGFSESRMRDLGLSEAQTDKLEEVLKNIDEWRMDSRDAALLPEGFEGRISADLWIEILEHRLGRLEKLDPGRMPKAGTHRGVPESDSRLPIESQCKEGSRMTIKEFLALSFLEQLKLSLADLKRVSKDARYFVHMGRWHRPLFPAPYMRHPNKCAVCLAGAKLTEWMDPDENYEPWTGNFGDDSLSEDEVQRMHWTLLEIDKFRHRVRRDAFLPPVPTAEQWIEAIEQAVKFKDLHEA